MEIQHPDSTPGIEGRMRFYAEIDIKASQMREWEPERILRFFEGIAQAIRARAVIAGVAHHTGNANPCGSPSAGISS